MKFALRSIYLLQTKGLLIIMAFFLVVFSGVEWLTTRSAERAIEAGVGRKTAILAEKIAQSAKSVSPEELAGKEVIAEILEMEPHIARVDVYLDHKGTLEPFHSSSRLSPRALDSSEKTAFYERKARTAVIKYQGGDEIFSTLPLQFKDGERGLVTVISRLKSIHDILSSRQLTRLFSVLGTTILLVLSIVVVYKQTIYHSVKHLVKVMHHYQKGDTEERADESMPGDFGELARNFNGLLDKLQGFNEALKQQISMATGELLQRNQDLKKLNLQIFRDKNRLNQAERFALAGQMTATFAHEIGSPLSAIATHLQILLEDAQLEPRVKDRLQLAYEQIERVCSIVESLLRTTRPSIRRAAVDLEGIVQKVICLLGPTIEMRKINFGFNCPQGPFWVEGDSDQLQQLFLNLLNNSLEALPDGGRLAVSIVRTPAPNKKTKQSLQIDVIDSGSGIAPERLEHIFEPFYTTKDPQRGTGLGLAVNREIVKQHGGQISVVSHQGQGTCFTIILPEVQPFSSTQEQLKQVKEATA
jgi:two-component system NtrC family sensor kinase